MSSVIPGFEYDLFISYRQKDNKGDRWVSEFVEALKTEIEATFKEDITIYFDENPHDSLKETYNVDKSLEGKLKCLIFIPILSQTYCDPDCYAWKYEFQVFNKIAGNDPIGPHVRLKNGNVANRVLPIRIHDLEPDDVKLFEKETGTVLRAVDFVFKTASGVNRPLRALEDHPQDNLNKTFYRDQMNKVANAIKEIIPGLKAGAWAGNEKIQAGEPLDTVPIVKRGEESKELKERVTKPALVVRRKPLLWTIPVGILAVIAAVLAYPKIFKRDNLGNLKSADGRISIAVMPFQNLTNDTTWNIWQGGIQDNLINFLSNSSDELKVRQRESINNLIQAKGLINYTSITPAVAGTISQKVEANVFIYGNIKQAGDTIRVSAQLIDSKTQEVFKVFEINGPSNEAMILKISYSLNRIVSKFLVISNLKKDVALEFRHLGSTNSPEAYRYFIYGQNAFLKRDYPTARNMLFQALAIDSSYYFAAGMLCYAYGNPGMYEEAKKWCLNLYGKRNYMPFLLKIYINATYSKFFETPLEQIKYWKQALELDDQVPALHYNIGGDYNGLYQYDNAIPEFKKALEIYKKWGCKPIWVFNYVQLGEAYHKTGQYNKEKKLYNTAEQDFPDDPAILYRQAILSLAEGDTKDANGYIEKYLSILKDNSRSEADIAASVAGIYSEAGVLEKAEKYYRQAIELEPDNPWWVNNLAYFLINNNRNLSEGMDFVERTLKLNPENWAFLDTKGWGLYKQGKYEEAMKVLQKSWDLRPVYSHQGFLHLEEVKQAIRKKNIK
jgi:tetratricopeptide (TPR) repeat protein